MPGRFIKDKFSFLLEPRPPGQRDTQWPVRAKKLKSTFFFHVLGGWQWSKDARSPFFSGCRPVFTEKRRLSGAKSLVGLSLCWDKNFLLKLRTALLPPPPHSTSRSVPQPPALLAAGSYMPVTGGSVCRPCEPRYACEDAGQIDSFVTPCAPGHYCPQSTSSRIQYPCPAGFYTDRLDLFREEDCEQALFFRRFLGGVSHFEDL